MKKVIIGMLSMFVILAINAQIAPDIDWREFDHPVNVIDGPMVVPFDPDGDPPTPGTEQNKEDSGEDWWYDIISYQDETESGYVVSGFASWVNIRLDETLAGGLLTYNDATADCNRPIMSDEILSQKLATVGKYNEEGEMIWCTPICKSAEGAMSIIHHDGGYVFTGWGKPTITNSDVPIQLRYNPRTTDPGYNMTDPTVPIENRKSKMFVGKLDENGELLWINSYGYYDMGGILTDEEVLGVSSIGYDLTVTANNEIRVVGFSEDLDDSRNLKIFIIDLDSDGYLSEIGSVNKRLAGAAQKNSQPREIEANADGTEFYITGFQHLPGNKSDAILFKIDENMDQVPFGNYSLDIGGTALFNAKAIIRYGYPGEGHSIGWDVKVLKKGKIAWAFIEKCNNCFGGGSNIGQGYVFVFNPDGITDTKFINLQSINTIGFSDVRAFDMKMGLIATNDGGFACVTSIKGQPNQQNTLDGIRNNLAGQIGYDCVNGEDIDGDAEININHEKYNYFDIWGTDAYVGKFNANGDMLWDKSFDSDDSPISNYPGDYKEQECVYRIAENAEGALTIVGNTSHNKDDYYIAKLESDCNTEYHITGDSNNKINIDGDQTWDDTPEEGILKVRGEVHVKSGATLTIDGITVEFADSRKCEFPTKIVVEQGARLVLKNGAVLTALSHCGDRAMWDGIEVWGDRFSSQSSSTHGWLIMRNSTIEHAHVGVTLMRPDYWNETGGVIQATGSFFINNRKSIAFMSYIDYSVTGAEKPNKSILSNTDFIWNNDFRHKPLNHVSLYKVYGVPFIGCHFSDDRTDDKFTSPYLESGSITKCGIRSIDAHYNVNAHCTDVSGCSGDIELDPWNASTFDNLDFGIYAGNSWLIYPIRVERSIFSNNLFGIEAIAISEPKILFNKFYYSDVNNYYLDDLKCGIKLERSEGIIVEENLFTNITASFDLVGPTIGIVCSNLGDSEEMVRRNRFERLTLGNLTEGRNRGTLGPGQPDGSKGLSFECNENFKNREDFKIRGTLGDDPTAADYSSDLYGIKNKMGLYFTHAGNVFSSPSFGHFVNQSTPPIGYHHNDLPLSETPLLGISPNTYLIPTPIINECKATYTSGTGGSTGIKNTEEENLNLKVDNSNDERNTPLSSLNLVDLYLQQSNLSEASLELNNLENSASGKPDHMKQEILDFIELKKVIITVLSQDINYLDMSVADKTSIEIIAQNGTGLAKYQAQELLCFFFDQCNSKSVILDENNAPSTINNTNKIVSNWEQFVSITPNPTNGIIKIDINSDQFNDALFSVELYSIQGQKLETFEMNSKSRTIDLQSYTDGIYFINIRNTQDNYTMKIIKQ